MGFLGYLSLTVFLVVAIFLGLGMLVQLALLRRAQKHSGRTREGQEDVSGQIEHLI